ncbi:aldo/keto reductase [Nonomuraea phyllanthi]|uniref:aldo/keto reductase n=1 Tax=Nonomuraea phyllanthi TaxID=2219224 RepID=UPI001292EA3B|nr:aldo/keto reductase [Nonomuraea phyllanthi]QFY11127.1 aldo/keto reductase [Nonomuraea phyllanthi]
MSPEPVLGTMTFGDTVDAGTAGRMLDHALDAGVTGVDTANGYAGGAAEEILGELLRGRRDRVVLATKAGIPHPDAGEHAPLSPAGLRASLEGSLRRLQVDHVDLFYLHQPDRATPLDDTLATVSELIGEGKIGSLGVSNHAAWQIAAMTPRPVVAQQLYNLLARRIEDEYAEFALTTGLRTMVYNPLGGGLLTGRHRFDRAPRSGRFGDSRLAEMYRKRYWDAGLFKAVEALDGIAAQAGLAPAELALRWLAGRPVVGAVLLGASGVDQLRANLAALAAGPLPADVAAECDAVSDTLRGPMPAYNR